MLGKKIDKARVGAGSIGQETIQCIRTVRAFANESEEAKRYSEKLNERYVIRRNEDVLGPTMATINQVSYINDMLGMVCWIIGNTKIGKN